MFCKKLFCVTKYDASYLFKLLQTCTGILTWLVTATGSVACVCVCVYVCVCARARVRACVRACVPTCARAVHVWLCVDIHVRIKFYLLFRISFCFVLFRWDFHALSTSISHCTVHDTTNLITEIPAVAVQLPELMAHNALFVYNYTIHCA